MTALDVSEGRYDRQALITWWDQDVLASAHVLVVGAGALGNELLKNLALVGVGKLTVYDLDVIEPSNLARCVLFRHEDRGQGKAAVAARRTAELNPDVDVTGRDVNVMHLGLGALDEFDLIVAGLDNREARAWLNQAARKLGRPWIDGAIEGLRGLARVFLPDGPCYECTLGETDRALLERRRSCTLLSADEMLTGKVPTTATSASIIAAVEVQEAIKLLHGRPDMLALHNQAFVYTGETLETYLLSYGEDPECLAHDRYGPREQVPYGNDLTLRDLFARAAGRAAGPLAADLESGVVVTGTCARCAGTKPILGTVATLSRESVRCGSCGEILGLDVRTSFAEDDDAPVTTPLRLLGLPDRDVVTIRCGARRWHYELTVGS